MTRPRGTSRRGAGHGVDIEVVSPGKGKVVNNSHDNSVSNPIHLLTDEWESGQVVDFITTSNYDNQINFYWLIKNMLDNLVE